jgi:hypothetical protein
VYCEVGTGFVLFISNSLLNINAAVVGWTWEDNIKMDLQEVGMGGRGLV